MEQQSIQQKSTYTKNKKYMVACRAKNIDETIRKEREKREKKRRAIIETLGGKCVACGYDKDIRALQIDHINGDGCKDRKINSYDKICKSIIKYGGQGKYQLLCANCNQIKRIENKEHGIRKRNALCHECGGTGKSKQQYYDMDAMDWITPLCSKCLGKRVIYE